MTTSLTRVPPIPPFGEASLPSLTPLRTSSYRRRRKRLAEACHRSQIVCVKTVTYPIRIGKRDYEMLMAEASRRRKSLADLFRDLITYGLPALPPIPESYEALQEVWDSLGPAPEILYDKLPRGR